MSKLNYTEVQVIVDQFVKVAESAHGYDYAAGAMSAMLARVIAETTNKNQTSALNHVFSMIELLEKRMNAPLL